MKRRETRRRAHAFLTLLVPFAVLYCIYLTRENIHQRSRSEERRTSLQATKEAAAQLQVAIHQTISPAEFASLSRPLLAAFKLSDDSRTPDRAALASRIARRIGALEHFWGRESENPSYVRTNEADLFWLAETGMANDTNVWMAFDFAGSINAYKSLLTHDRTFFVNNFALSPDYEAALMRAHDASNVVAYTDYLTERSDEILADASRRREAIAPEYIRRQLMLLIDYDLFEIARWE